MADNTVKLIIQAVDQASKTVKGVEGSFGKLNKTFESLTGVSLTTAGAITAVGIGLEKAVKYIKEAVNETVAYNKTIREMTQVTGLGADEISRIVQVGDDWGVSIDAIRTSLAFMNKSGMTPSIDNLAKLADEYVNTADKSAFAEKAVKVLGRGYQTLIPLLALGGKGLKDATGAIEGNLIATDNSIKASRDYEVALDTLNDTFLGVKYVVGNDVIPVLTDFLSTLNDISSWIANNKDLLYAIESIDPWILLSRALHNLKKESQGVIEQWDGIDKAEKDLVITTDNVTESTNYATDSITTFGRETDAVIRTQVVKALKNAKDATDALNQSYDDMNYAIDGKLGPSMEEFNQTQAELTTKMEENRQEFKTAILQGYSLYGEKVQGLQGDYRNLQGQYKTNADEHDEATKRIMFDILEQRAAIGGLTNNEITFLQQVALQWGLTDQATLDYMAHADSALTFADVDPEKGLEILNGQETAWWRNRDAIQNAKDVVDKYAAALAALDGKTVNTSVHTTMYYDDQGHGRRQHGGPVTGGHSYTVGEAGPETFVPSQSGVIIPNQNTYNNQHYTFNVHTNASSSTLRREYNMAKAMAN